MKHYTIGAVFGPNDFSHVLLIEKKKPDWQKGFLNFPGGSVEPGEGAVDCVAREFREETALKIPASDWRHLGVIKSELGYTVDFFGVEYKEEYGEPESLTDETIDWEECDNLPQNCISNIYWLVPFAINMFLQGNADHLAFGEFNYKAIPVPQSTTPLISNQ